MTSDLEQRHRMRRFVAGLVMAMSLVASSEITLADSDPVATALHQGVLQKHEANALAADSIALGTTDCVADPIYAALIMMPGLEFSSAQHELQLHYADGFSDMRLAADDFIVIAAATAKRGCTTQARELYTHVIGTFVGTAYDGPRQRARTGIAGLRKGDPQVRSGQPPETPRHGHRPLSHRGRKNSHVIHRHANR